MLKQLLGNSYLFGANAPFIEGLYEAWLRDPAAVEPRWRDYFDELQRLDRGAADVSHYEVQQRFAQAARGRRAHGPAVVINRPQLGEKQLPCCSSFRPTASRERAMPKSILSSAARSRISPNSTPHSTD